MSDSSRNRNVTFALIGLGIALAIATFLSPFASKDPDGLNRVAQDHKFDGKAAADTPAKQLPFHQVFEAYALRGVPKEIATPLAGIIGTLAAFGLAWGVGKVVVRNSGVPPEDDRISPD